MKELNRAIVLATLAVCLIIAIVSCGGVDQDAIPGIPTIDYGSPSPQMLATIRSARATYESMIPGGYASPQMLATIRSARATYESMIPGGYATPEPTSELSSPPSKAPSFYEYKGGVCATYREVMSCNWENYQPGNGENLK